MRIIQLITKKQRRGAEIFACQLASVLISKGHEVVVLSLFEGNADLPFEGKIKSLQVDPEKRFYDWKSWKYLAEFIREFKPDIIQANASETLKFAVFSKMIFGWKNPIVFRNANQMSGFLRNSLQKSWNKFLLERMAGIASVSEASKNDLNQTFQLNGKPIQVIPIGIDSLDINQKVNRKENPTLPDSFMIQIGSWVAEKDPLGMISTFEKLSSEVPELHFIFMGSGPLENEMIKRINALDLAERIHLIPNQQNIFPVLSKAKALVMPSKIEGLPGVILEAMFCRVPVIAYGVGGIPEVLVTHQTGWCILPTDQKGFISAIEEVLSINTQKKETILSNAYELVSTKFTLDNVSRQFEIFYSSLINPPQKTDNN